MFGANVVLDMGWLTRALKPILDHKVDARNEDGVAIFGGRKLDTAALLSDRDALVHKGILRKDFAGYLWRVGDQNEEAQMMLHNMLVTLGVAIPLPQGSPENITGRAKGDSKCCDLLIIMRLSDEPSPDALGVVGEVLSPRSGLKATWVFHEGAPYGLPERILALCHRLGLMSSQARWRYGALFEDERGARLVLRYEKTSCSMTAETIGQESGDFESLRFAASAILHIGREFPWVSWEGRVECMRHPGSTMYNISSSEDRRVRVGVLQNAAFAFA